MFEAGQTLKELAWVYGISTSRVRQVINKERRLLSITHCDKCGQKLMK
jgi:DNA-directed RNA polymerase specialized sigma subunit